VIEIGVGKKGGSAVKSIIWVTAVAAMLMFSIVMLTSCDGEELGIQNDEKSEESAEISSEKSGSSSNADHGSLYKDVNKDISDDGLSLQYNFSNQSTVYSTNSLLYFFNRDGNRLECEKRIVIAGESEHILKKAIEQLALGPKVKGLEAVIPEGVKVEKVECYNNIVNVYLSKEFLEAKDLLIARAALVNTVLGAKPEADYVKIYVDGYELTDNGKEDGLVLGLLSKYPEGLEEIKAREFEKFSGKDIVHIYREIYFQDQNRRFLVPEIRHIVVKQGGVAEAVVEELLKGPSIQDHGLYPTMPKGTQLLDINYVEDSQSSKGIELYFSKEFDSAFDNEINSEFMMIGSLTHSLTGLPGVDWIKIYYQNEKGEYVDTPIMTLDLQRKFGKDSLPFLLGRRIKVYFSDKDVMNLVPEYRVISQSSEDVATEIMNELIEGPMEDEHIGVIPEHLTIDDVSVWIENKTAFVNLPSSINGPRLGSTGETMVLYSIVNSLTDPVNAENVKQVQFLVDGKYVEEFGNMSLAEPFVRNPALIKE